jgi:hypothetical protein
LAIPEVTCPCPPMLRLGGSPPGHESSGGWAAANEALPPIAINTIMIPIQARIAALLYNDEAAVVR